MLWLCRRGSGEECVCVVVMLEGQCCGYVGGVVVKGVYVVVM